MTLVVGVDGSEPSRDALCWACGEARRLEARAIAVFVSSAVDATVVGLAATVGLDIGDYAVGADRAHDPRVARLPAEVKRRAAEHDLDLTFIHAWGDPVGELLRIAEAVQADVIVVGRSTKLRHRLAGSLARRLLSQRRAPIIVVVP
jgi:nucleotide-binding universal stress UspA family protein